MSLVEGFTVLRDNARIESFQPHMHLRGKAMMVEAILANGQKQVLSYVDDFNFNWMTTYVYADDVAPLLPKGTILKVTAWHDNTAAKKSNPDPTQWVGWGDRTVDEMAHAWINIVYMKDEDFKVEQEKRRTSRRRRSRNKGGTYSYRFTKTQRSEPRVWDIARATGLFQGAQRLVDSFGRQLERTEVHADALGRAEVEVRLHRLCRIHVNRLHEPARFVGPDR